MSQGIRHKRELLSFYFHRNGINLFTFTFHKTKYKGLIVDQILSDVWNNIKLSQPETHLLQSPWSPLSGRRGLWCWCSSSRPWRESLGWKELLVIIFLVCMICRDILIFSAWLQIWAEGLCRNSHYHQSKEIIWG